MFDCDKVKKYYSMVVDKTQKDCSEFSKRPSVINCFDEIFKKLDEMDILGPGKHFLDIGGSGHVCEMAQQRGLGTDIVTISPSELELLKKKGIKASLQDMNFLDFPDEHFDVIFASHILEHSPVPLFSLMEWKRVLKRSGRLIVFGPIGGDYQGHEDSNSVYGLAEHIICPTEWQYKWLFALAGLHIEYESDINRRNKRKNFIAKKAITSILHKMKLDLIPSKQLKRDIFFVLKHREPGHE